MYRLIWRGDGTYVCMNTTRACAHACTHARTHTRTHAHARTHARTHTHTHTPDCRPQVLVTGRAACADFTSDHALHQHHVIVWGTKTMQTTMKTAIFVRNNSAYSMYGWFSKYPFEASRSSSGAASVHCLTVNKAVLFYIKGRFSLMILANNTSPKHVVLADNYMLGIKILLAVLSFLPFHYEMTSHTQTQKHKHVWKSFQPPSRGEVTLLVLVPRGLTFTWWGCCGFCFWHKPTELAHSLFLCLFLSLWPFRLYFIP